MTDYQEVSTSEQEQGRGQRIATNKASQLIWIVLGILEAMLAIRVVFSLIAVNGANPFAMFIYDLTNYFVAPFMNLTGVFISGNNVLEIPAIIAMLVYLLVAWGLERIVNVLFSRPRGPVTVTRTVVSDHSPH